MQRRKLADAIRALSMDAVQAANSGHPGAPMGMADIAEVLWNGFLKHSPQHPQWFDRDRFVLSNGHASMLLYSLLHLSGYDLPIAELKNFRQLHSKTPGHPELGCAPGVETTTGPLGQGLANAVGMAIAERRLAAEFNQPELDIVDHYTYVFLGDGCLMEGISHEACSLAGTLRLGKLIAFYDDNGISIDGDVDGWFTDDTAGRFAAYGWQVIDNVDGHDAEAIEAAVTLARKQNDRPTLICCKTLIGYGAPNKQGTGSAHGAPLGDEEISRVREQLDWSHAPFEIPQDIADAWCAKNTGAERVAEWQKRCDAYKDRHPQLWREFERRMNGELPADWAESSANIIKSVSENGQTIASRKASLNALNHYGPLLPELIGGSADLKPSNLTFWDDSIDIADNPGGNYIHFGVREFAMSAIANGMAVHGGQKVYVATFLMFSEYARNALRVAALMKTPSIFVYTHDSIGVGEDGPTHQPVEQAATLRLMPNMSVWRPCDDVETAVAWKYAIERDDGPTSLLFSRQNLPHVDRNDQQLAAIERGGYILRGEEEANLQAIIIATGSEVSLALEAAAQLDKDGIEVRVVSMPSTDVFDAQAPSYRELVLPGSITRRVAVEAGVSDGWYKYIGLEGTTVCLDRFGESGPAGEVFEHFGFTAGKLAESVRKLLR